MLVNELEDRFEAAQDQFWDGHGFCDLTSSERTRLNCLDRLKKTVSTMPATLRDRASELFAVDADATREVLKSMIEEVGPQYCPADAASFVTTMARRLEAQIKDSSAVWQFEGESPRTSAVILEFRIRKFMRSSS